MTSDYGSPTPGADACPFCGCYPVERAGRFGGIKFYIRCPECGARTKYTLSTEQAIELWNRRSKP